MSGVWEPRRTPLALSALASLPASSRSRFESTFSKPTDVQCHLWTAAARGESAVVVAPRRSGGRLGLTLVAEPGGHEVVEKVGVAGRELTLNADAWSLTVIEPRSDAGAFAESVAATRGRCAFVDVTSYETIRARVFAPFRDEPTPDRDSLVPHFDSELDRLRAQPARLALIGTDAAAGQLDGPDVVVFRDGCANSAVAARAGGAADGPWHDAATVVFFAGDWRGALLCHVVARRVREGALDADGVDETESEAICARWIERLRTSDQPEEHAAYALVTGLGMNRGNAIAVVRGARWA